MNIKLSNLTVVGWLLVLTTCAVYGVLTTYLVLLSGWDVGGTIIALLCLPVGILFFAAGVVALKAIGLPALKRGSEGEQAFFPPPDEKKQGTWLKCDHCGALQPVGTAPVECDWCHKVWAGREVTT